MPQKGPRLEPLPLIPLSLSLSLSLRLHRPTIEDEVEQRLVESSEQCGGKISRTLNPNHDTSQVFVEKKVAKVVPLGGTSQRTDFVPRDQKIVVPRAPVPKRALPDLTPKKALPPPPVSGWEGQVSGLFLGMREGGGGIVFSRWGSKTRAVKGARGRGKRKMMMNFMHGMKVSSKDKVLGPFLYSDEYATFCESLPEQDTYKGFSDVRPPLSEIVNNAAGAVDEADDSFSMRHGDQDDSFGSSFVLQRKKKPPAIETEVKRQTHEHEGAWLNMKKFPVVSAAADGSEIQVAVPPHCLIFSHGAGRITFTPLEGGVPVKLCYSRAVPWDEDDNLSNMPQHEICCLSGGVTLYPLKGHKFPVGPGWVTHAAYDKLKVISVSADGRKIDVEMPRGSSQEEVLYCAALLPPGGGAAVVSAHSLDADEFYQGSMEFEYVLCYASPTLGKLTVMCAPAVPPREEDSDDSDYWSSSEEEEDRPPVDSMQMTDGWSYVVSTRVWDGEEEEEEEEEEEKGVGKATEKRGTNLPKLDEESVQGRPQSAPGSPMRGIRGSERNNPYPVLVLTPHQSVAHSGASPLR